MQQHVGHFVHFSNVVAHFLLTDLVDAGHCHELLVDFLVLTLQIESIVLLSSGIYFLTN